MLMVPFVVSVTVIEFSAEVVTVIVVEPEIELFFVEVAVMVAVPALTAVASPFESIVAMVWSEEAHVASTFELLPSSFTPLAVNCCVPPTAIVGVAGVTLIDCSTGPVKKPRQEVSTRMMATATINDALRVFKGIRSFRRRTQRGLLAGNLFYC